MLQWSADWLYGIAAVLLFGTVILQGMPEGTYQKYARLFLGALLVMAVISPLFSRWGLTEETRLSFEQGMVSSWLDGIMADEEWQVSEAWEQTMQQQIRQKQEAWLQEPLAALAEEYGFSCLRYAVEWNEAGDWPRQLTLWVTRRDETAATEEDHVAGAEMSGILSVEPVSSVGEPAAPTGEGIPSLGEVQSSQGEPAVYYEPSELRPLHQALQTVWQLPEEQILLYWERS